jgi:hypothetical protein
MESEAAFERSNVSDKLDQITG